MLKEAVLVLSYSAGDLRDKCSTSAGKVVSKHPLNSEFFYFEIGEPRGRYRWQSIESDKFALPKCCGLKFTCYENIMRLCHF